MPDDNNNSGYINNSVEDFMKPESQYYFDEYFKAMSIMNPVERERKLKMYKSAYELSINASSFYEPDDDLLNDIPNSIPQNNYYDYYMTEEEYQEEMEYRAKRNKFLVILTGIVLVVIKTFTMLW